MVIKLPFIEFFINIARGMLTLICGLVLYQNTGSIYAFAVVICMDCFSAILLQSLSGSLVDRFGPKIIIFFSLLTNIFLISIYIFTVQYFSEKQIILLTFIAIMLNCIRPFIRNSIYSLTFMYAKESNITFHYINGRMTAGIQLGQIVGVVFAGVMLYYNFIIFQFYIVGLAFIASLLILLFIHPPSVKLDCTLPDYKTNYFSLLRIVFSQPNILKIFVLCTFDYMAIGIFNLYLAPAVDRVFNGDAYWISILDILFAIGALLGSLIISNLKKTINVFIATLLSMTTLVSIIFCYLLLLPPYYILAFSFLFGLTSAISMLLWTEKIQGITDINISGRISAIKNIFVALFVSLICGLATFSNATNIDDSLLLSICVFLSICILLFSFLTIHFFRFIKTQS